MLFKKKKELEEIETRPELPPLPPLPEEMEAPELPELEEELPMVRPMRMAPMPREEVVCPPCPPSRSELVKVFVRIDKYKEVMKEIESMQHKVSELQKTLNKISSIKEREAEIITGWNALLAEAKAKIDEVDHKLMRPEHIC